MLLDTPLKYDEPFEVNLCKSCTACIDACPTKALSEYKLDATKCISYLTTEYKEDFDPTQMKQLNDWVYGCDICQQVCPWNKTKQQNPQIKLFSPRNEIKEYTLNDWSNIDIQQFREIFKKSPIGRIKLHRFKRNVGTVIQSQSID